MKLTKIIMIFAAVMVLASVSIAADEKPWFDMKNCAFCKNLTTDPNLLKNMSWEHYDISNGVMVITCVTPAYKESYKNAMAAMQKIGEEMQKGKTDVPMCGHCQAYGALMMAGAKFEYVPAKVGDIVTITSDKPELLAQIKSYGKRCREEMAKLEAAEKAKN